MESVLEFIIAICTLFVKWQFARFLKHKRFVRLESPVSCLKSHTVCITIGLIRHNDGKSPGNREARFVDPDGNEFLLHT